MRKYITFVAILICGGELLMARKASLKRYAAQRDFSTTSEPKPGRIRRSTKKHQPIFVIQRHDASHLHYDVRLEIDGVLVSWAVPKGPPKTTAIKRLAIQTEDHPMAYADFQGTIEQGYGAGQVRIWDKGTYCNLKDTGLHPISMQQALHNGRIELYLHGKILDGPYALIRTNYGEDKKNWLLMKLKKKGIHACT